MIKSLSELKQGSFYENENGITYTFIGINKDYDISSLKKELQRRSHD